MSGRLRSYARLSSQSQKVKDGAHDFRAVYAEVDARSEGRCEWTEWVKMVADSAGRCMTSLRCRKRAREHHHTVKPRRSPLNHRAELIIHLCPDHHARCEYPYKRGRGVAVGRGDGTFDCSTQFFASKFQARGQGE